MIHHSHQAHQTFSFRDMNYLLIFGLGLLIGIQVYLSNQIATTGSLLNNLEKQAVDIEETNRKLLSENVNYLSLAELSKKATELGYVEPENVLNLGDGTHTLASR